MSDNDSFPTQKERDAFISSHSAFHSRYKRVDIPGRPSHLPTLYEVTKHALWQKGRTFVYVADPRELARNNKIYNASKVPFGSTHKQMQEEQGYKFLQPGDSVYCRLISGPGTEEEDIPVLYMIDRNIVALALSEVVQKLETHVQKLLGPRSQRDGSDSSTIPFETSPRSGNIRQGLRCYPSAVTVEKVRGLVAHPCKNMSATLPSTSKYSKEKLQEDLEDRQLLNKVSNILRLY